MAMTGATISTIQVSTSAALSSASPLNIEAWAGDGSNMNSVSSAPGSQRRMRHFRGEENFLVDFICGVSFGIPMLQDECEPVSCSFKYFLFRAHDLWWQQFAD